MKLGRGGGFKIAFFPGGSSREAASYVKARVLANQYFELSGHRASTANVAVSALCALLLYIKMSSHVRSKLISSLKKLLIFLYMVIGIYT